MTPETFGVVAGSHRLQLALCDELEAVADSLPRDIDQQRCLTLARAICPTVARAHLLEENILFPALHRRWSNVPGLAETLERLRFEHYEDMCFAEEVHDALLSVGRGEPTPSAAAIGYMLRGFFEAVRRHIAFESELLVPLLRISAEAVSRTAPLADRG